MKKDLLIALGRHKRVIIIFLLTIFVPSVILSVLGVRAIRNERFRLAKQLEEEQMSNVDFIKTRISSRVDEVENTLEHLTQTPSLINRDYEAINILLESRIDENPLLKQFFLFYKEGGPWFPPLQPAMDHPASISRLELNEDQQEKLKNAEVYEFTRKNYQSAISIYHDLMTEVKNDNDQAQLLNRIARNMTKKRAYDQAIRIYSSIVNDHPESKTSSGLPLAIIARLQLAECYQCSGELDNALKEAFKLYEKLLDNSWILSENQFITYASMVQEMIKDILQKDTTGVINLDEYNRRLEQLTTRHNNKLEQWQIISDLKAEIIPQFERRLMQSASLPQIPSHYYQTINNHDFLVVNATILDKNDKDYQGILGVKLNNDYLENDVLNDIINIDMHSRENIMFTIYNLNGRILFGERDAVEEISNVTAFFDNNFPPWRIEAHSHASEGTGLIGLHKSFYFWTILTLLIIFSFGVVLIARTVSHEMEVLRIKSDFVSSVSHEFKTPLTSIKTLTERLMAGKVKDQAKMNQYFSVISHDTNKLTHLVGNILDFAKIEEGKKEYNLEDTDLIEWLDETVENFRKENLQKQIQIHTEFPTDNPHLSIDRNAMTLVVNNLLDNAIRYSTNNNKIELMVTRDEENLLIKVRDFGIGIPRNELSKIFEKFYQASNATRLSTQGTGLGLTLVRHTVESHGGQVYVESQVNQGSTFTISLPINNNTAGGE